MGRTRLEFEGLVAFVKNDEAAGVDRVTTVTALFVDPWAFGLHPHRPTLIVDELAVDSSHTTVKAVKSQGGKKHFDLASWDVSILTNGEQPDVEEVALPKKDEPDPDGGTTKRKLSTFSNVLDIGTACGDSRVNCRYFRNPPPPELLGRLRLNTGVVQTMSNDFGEFDKWKFLVGKKTVHQQKAADTVVWRPTMFKMRRRTSTRWYSSCSQ